MLARLTRLPATAFWLVGLTVLAYAPSFSAGFLNWDDPWLIENNPAFKAPGLSFPLQAFTDLSRETRLAFGAEYLPLRDLLTWLETRLFGIWAPGMHAVSVLLYAVAVLLLRGTLVRTFGRGLAVEVASLLFALHPAHAESVAWLAGQKDLLALSFVCAGLFTHAGDSRHRTWLVPLLVLCAGLSKAMSVAVIALLWAEDFVRARRFDWAQYAPTALVIVSLLALHVHVGRVVGMTTSPAGGTRWTAIMTMGPVWLRYLALAFQPFGHSITHDVPDRLHLDLYAVLGYVVICVWLALGVLLVRRGERRVLYLFVWFFAPLAPVSQVLSPLQNRMADRYLWLSVLAPALAYGFLFARLAARKPRLAHALVALCVGLWFVRSFERSVLFSDDVLLFTDGMQRTEYDLDAPLQLGIAYDARGEPERALVAFAEVRRRAPTGASPDVRRAYNLSARILAKQARLVEAEALLREARVRFPHDKTTRDNLAKVLRGMHRDAEAEALTMDGADGLDSLPVGPSP